LCGWLHGEGEISDMEGLPHSGHLLKDHLEKGKHPGMVGHFCNPSTWEVEAWRSRVQGQPGLHSDTLSQNKTKCDSNVLSFSMSYCNFSWVENPDANVSERWWVWEPWDWWWLTFQMLALFPALPPCWSIDQPPRTLVQGQRLVPNTWERCKRMPEQCLKNWTWHHGSERKGGHAGFSTFCHLCVKVYPRGLGVTVIKSPPFLYTFKYCFLLWQFRKRIFHLQSAPTLHRQGLFLHAHSLRCQRRGGWHALEAPLSQVDCLLLPGLSRPVWWPQG
jgi:hypothetical protein